MTPEFHDVSLELQKLPSYTGHGWGPAGVLSINQAEYQDICERATALTDALVHACETSMDEGPASAGRTLGVPDFLTPYMGDRWDRAGTTLSRVDFVISEGVPRFLEWNFASALGGTMEVDYINRVAGAALGLKIPGLPHERRLAHCRDTAQLHGTSRVVIPNWPWTHIPDPVAHFAGTLEWFREHGIDATLGELSDPAEVDEPVVALKLYDSIEAQMHGVPLDSLGLENSAVRWVAPEQALAYSSKLLMGLDSLWKSADPGPLGLPDTRVVDCDDARFRSIGRDALCADQEKWVIKPASEGNGRGVMVGAGCSRDAWAEAVGASPLVAQRYAAPDLSHVRLHSVEDAHDVPLEVTVVYGLYLIDGAPAGILARMMPSGSRVAAINYATGAVGTSVLVRT